MRMSSLFYASMAIMEQREGKIIQRKGLTALDSQITNQQDRYNHAENRGIEKLIE